MSAVGEFATSAAKDFVPARPSVMFGSCCMNDSAKYRSTAAGSFLRKISIMASRALAPRVSGVMLRSSGVWLAADWPKREPAEPTIAIIAVLPPAAKRWRLDIFMAACRKRDKGRQYGRPG